MKRIITLLAAVLLLSPLAAQKNMEALRQWLSACNKEPIESQKFASKSLSQAEAKTAADIIYESVSRRIKLDWNAQWTSGEMREGRYLMPFSYKLFGEKPADGRSLFISMHGGGGAPAKVNDKQWENQKRLYRLDEGVYLTPRAAVNEWNMWFQPHVDSLFDMIIQTAIVELDVNPDKVYLMGYSAGGDGVWRLAPRMADRWAAASMMAGHPGGVSMMNLRNTPFMIWMGANDGAYNRNQEAAKYGETMDALQKDDPTGYIHQTHIVAGKGHWMESQDTAAVAWMAQYKRNPYPTKVVWRQDDTPHESLYWLSVPLAEAKNERTAIVERSGNTFTIVRNDYPELTIGLNDEMIDFNRPVKVIADGKTVFDGKLTRTVAALYRSLTQRKDPKMVFSAYLTVKK